MLHGQIEIGRIGKIVVQINFSAKDGQPDLDENESNQKQFIQNLFIRAGWNDNSTHIPTDATAWSQTFTHEHTYPYMDKINEARKFFLESCIFQEKTAFVTSVDVDVEDIGFKGVTVTNKSYHGAFLKLDGKSISDMGKDETFLYLHAISRFLDAGFSVDEGRGTLSLNYPISQNYHAISRSIFDELGIPHIDRNVQEGQNRMERILYPFHPTLSKPFKNSS